MQTRREFLGTCVALLGTTVSTSASVQEEVDPLDYIRVKVANVAHPSQKICTLAEFEMTEAYQKVKNCLWYRIVAKEGEFFVIETDQNAASRKYLRSR